MLIIDDLAVRVAGRLLIEHATVRIPPGARIGFVGRNGSGKSTLFNVITHDVAAEHGDIELPSRWRVGRLAQEAPDVARRMCSRQVADETTMNWSESCDDPFSRETWSARRSAPRPESERWRARSEADRRRGRTGRR